MTKDGLVKVLLVVVAALLFLNLFNRQILSLIVPDAIATQNIDWATDSFKSGVSVACSADGKYVYAASHKNILRSTEFGKDGSWEEVVK